jgi:hypothetical protein
MIMRRFSAIILGVGLLAMAAAIWYVTSQIRLFEQHKKETAEVILNQMQTVTKLVTAEGYFSEVYDYKDYYQWDIGLLRKKALMRVKAKVVMGYDLEKLNFNIDSATKRITIQDATSPEILALEHDVDFYDLTSGTFNKFAEGDLNELQKRAKNFISEVAMQSNLVELANARKAEIYETLRIIAESAGYTLVIVPMNQPVMPHEPLLLQQ